MFFCAIFLENDKEKILEILGRVSEKKKLDKLKAKYKELYGKVRICICSLGLPVRLSSPFGQQVGR